MVPNLTAYRCTGCGHTSLPRRARCRRCGAREVEEVELRRGKLLTFSRVAVTRPGYPSPLTLGLAEFEHGVKLVARIDDPSPQLDMEVRPELHGADGARSDRPADVVLVRART